MLDLNALNGFASFAAKLVSDLLRTAADHGDDHRVIFIIEHLVPYLREFAEDFLNLSITLTTVKINLKHHCCYLLFLR